MNISKVKLKLKWWWKAHQPFISRKEHLRILQERIASVISYNNEELRKKEKILDDLIPKLIQVSLSKSESNYGVFRCQVEFNTDLIYGSFIHGNSQEQIRYVAAHISRLIERELLTINFARFSGYGEDRYLFGRPTSRPLPVRHQDPSPNLDKP